MIINTRADYDAAPKDERDRVKTQLAAGINRWQWSGKEWKLTQDTSNIEAFGFTLKDFPDAPTPPKPDYNPDARDKERAIAAAIELRRTSYREISDPLFFKVQRGEATEAEWLAAVAEIKARYPKVEAI